MRQNQIENTFKASLKKRGQVMRIGWIFVATAILSRLFYWQVIKGSSLRAEAESQYTSTTKTLPSRGKLYFANHELLVGNQTVYRMLVNLPELELSPDTATREILPILLPEYDEYKAASEAATQKETAQIIEAQIKAKISQTDKKWVTIKARVSEGAKQQLEAKQIKGMQFDPYETRFYPEASMAAHITGFVGKDEKGDDLGYFGVEGALDKELRGQTIKEVTQTDALGFKMLFGPDTRSNISQGRDVILTIHRDIQQAVENLLTKGIEQYGAKSGEVIVMDPQNGDILALAAWPSYDQQHFYQFDQSLYKNPTLTNLFEPGSIFKPLTVSAGIDTNKIKEDTQCPVCASARRIGQYTIKTWNDKYQPNITMTEALAKSDNTAMIFIADEIGQDSFLEYIHRFGIGQKINIDIQEDSATPIREKWGDIHRATSSFGQGIVTNSMQMIRAIGAIANQGRMMRPRIVSQVIDQNDQKAIVTEPIQEQQVISPETAVTVSRMMVMAAQEGEAKWTSSQVHTVAAKTGTSQIPIEGGYDPDKTIVTYVGFAPADKPRFVMLVKLVEPTSSIWAAETAAPLWYRIASKLFLLLEIPPDKDSS